MRYLKTVAKTRVELQALQTAGTTIPADVEIRITDPNPGEPDVYRGTGGTVTQAVTQATSASSGGASVSPIPQSFAGTGAVALTQAAHSGRNWHAEPGQTSLTLAAADWPAGGEFTVINHTGADLPITLGTGWTGAYTNERDGQALGPVAPATEIAANTTVVTLPYLTRAVVQVKDGSFVNVAVTGAGGGPQYDDWAALTRVKRFEVRRAPTAVGELKVGDLIRSTATRTTRASFDATEAAAWSEVSADPVTSVAGKTGAVNLVPGDVGAAASAHTHPQSDVTNLTTDLAAKETTANKGAVNGYAGLGADGRVPFAQLPTSVGIGFRLWVPEDLAGVRAIDVNFESAALGALSTIANTGTLGGTATAAVGEEPTVDAVDATGRRGALFDGTNDSLRSSAIWSLGTTYGLFAVYRRAATGAGMLLSTEYPTNVSYTLGQVQDAVNNGVGGNMVFFGHFNGSWRSHAANSVLANALGIVVGNFDGVSLNVRIFGTDNTAAQTSLSGAPSGNTRIGRRWDTAGNNYFAGRIFRIICKVGAFTTAEMQQLEGWAAHRFGAAASLPAAHPYRANPPIVAL